MVFRHLLLAARCCALGMTELPWTEHQLRLRCIAEQAPRNEQGDRGGPHSDVAACAREVEYAVCSQCSPEVMFMSDWQGRRPFGDNAGRCLTLTQLEQGIFLSHLTLRDWQVAQDKTLAYCSGVGVVSSGIICAAR